jgi:hypothetical protein
MLCLENLGKLSVAITFAPFATEQAANHRAYPRFWHQISTIHHWAGAIVPECGGLRRISVAAVGCINNPPLTPSEGAHLVWTAVSGRLIRAER